jgi:hypothetical protein
MTMKFAYLIGAAILGCASAGTSGTSTAPRNRNLLTAEEIAAANADASSAYDAIARLRPIWLTRHGATSITNQSTDTEMARVFVNGQHYGDVGSLRNIEAMNVADIRYYGVSESGVKYGLRGGHNGVIDVRLK